MQGDCNLDKRDLTEYLCCHRFNNPAYKWALSTDFKSRPGTRLKGSKKVYVKGCTTI